MNLIWSQSTNIESIGTPIHGTITASDTIIIHINMRSNFFIFIAKYMTIWRVSIDMNRSSKNKWPQVTLYFKSKYTFIWWTQLFFFMYFLVLVFLHNDNLVKLWWYKTQTINQIQRKNCYQRWCILFVFSNLEQEIWICWCGLWVF